MKYIKRLWVRFWALFGNRAKTQTNTRQNRVVAQTNDYQTFATLRGLLETLDAHFEAIKVLRKYDPDAHLQYSRFGAFLAPSQPVFDRSPKSISKDMLPTFAALTFPKFDTDETDLRLVTMRRVDRPRNAQPSNGIVLELCAVSTHKVMEKPFLMRWYAAFEGEGFRALKVFRQKHQQLPNGPSITHTTWGFPEIAEYMAKDRGMPVDKYLEEATAIVVSGLQAHGYNLQVRCERDGEVARFGIDLLRTPYFFKDREAVDGKRKKKIFHIVRAHKRNTKGKIKYVRSHFRGQRKFTWAGCKVELIMPGKHASHSALEYMMDGYEPDDSNTDATLAADEVAKVLDNHSRGLPDMFHLTREVA